MKKRHILSLRTDKRKIHYFDYSKANIVAVFTLHVLNGEKLECSFEDVESML